MNDIEREIKADEELMSIKGMREAGEVWELEPDDEPLDADLAHKLLLEREQLLADGVKKKADRLKKIEDRLKDICDKNGGPIVDETLGKVFYEHGWTTVDWDTNTLLQVLGRLSEELEYKVDSASVKKLLDSGKITEREIEPARIKRPRRGPLTITPLPRSLKEVS